MLLLLLMVDLLENSLLVRWLRCCWFWLWLWLWLWLWFEFGLAVGVAAVDAAEAVRGLRLLPALRMELVSLIARERFSCVGFGRWLDSAEADGMDWGELAGLSEGMFSAGVGVCCWAGWLGLSEVARARRGRLRGIRKACFFLLAGDAGLFCSCLV